jgi:hypothetical protein
MVVAAVVVFLVGLLLVREGIKPVGESTVKSVGESTAADPVCRPPMSATSMGSG